MVCKHGKEYFQLEANTVDIALELPGTDLIVLGSTKTRTQHNTKRFALYIDRGANCPPTIKEVLQPCIVGTKLIGIWTDVQMPATAGKCFTEESPNGTT